MGKGILELRNLENEAVGIESGYIYHNSPIICFDDGSSFPLFEWGQINPSTCSRWKVVI